MLKSFLIFTKQICNAGCFFKHNLKLLGGKAEMRIFEAYRKQFLLKYVYVIML